MFGKAPTLELALDQTESSKIAPLARDRRGPRAIVLADGQDVTGTASIAVRAGSKFDHQGIKVEFVGQVDMINDRSKSYDFFHMSKDLEPPGTLFQNKTYNWRFGNVSKEHETYHGKNVRLRYFVRVTAVQPFNKTISKEVDMVVQNIFEPEAPTPIKMEVGIEEMLRIEFEFGKSHYHMRDVIVGKVYFMCVRIKIKHMELKILRREMAGPATGQQQMENDTLAEFEIMDGAPVKDQCIPVRLYLTGLELTPTYTNVQNKFSVKYLLNLVLIDEEDRKYFKKQEINIYRNRIG